MNGPRSCESKTPAPRPHSWRTWTLFGRPWQDLIFAAAEIVFLIALVPLLWSNTYVPPYTGLTTGLTLYLISLCQFSYRNWLTVALGVTAATVWVLLGFGVRL